MSDWNHAQVNLQHGLSLDLVNETFGFVLDRIGSVRVISSHSHFGSSMGLRRVHSDIGYSSVYAWSDWVWSMPRIQVNIGLILSSQLKSNRFFGLVRFLG